MTRKKRTEFGKTLAAFSGALLLMGCGPAAVLSGCGLSGNETPVEEPQKEGTPLFSEALSEIQLQTGGNLFQIIQTSEKEASVSGHTMENVSYVMIYNPFVYQAARDAGFGDELTARSTGSMEGQIQVGGNRAGFLDSPEFTYGISRGQIDGSFDDSEANREGGRGGFTDYPVYEVSDTEDFYHYDETLSERMKSTFTCMYAGEHCYIWVLSDSVDSDTAQEFGDVFDNRIYDLDTENFGEGRFTEDGGKVHILFYPFQEEVLGFFTVRDIFSGEEYPEPYAENYQLNVDKAIINMNAQFDPEDPEQAYATLAHEYQHQISASEAFYYVDSPYISEWLDEVMAASAEELAYPGTKEANYYNQLIYLSDSIRCGQSLYDFSTEDDEYIGAYGNAYLFEEFVKGLESEQVFTDVHSYWRDSYSEDVTEAEALYYAFPEEIRDRISRAVTYPSDISQEFSTEYEEWLSKLTMLYYMKTTDPEFSNLSEYTDVIWDSMLYTGIDEAVISGGGRIFVATEDGSYTVPDDASDGLVYLGFDEQFHLAACFTK